MARRSVNRALTNTSLPLNKAHSLKAVVDSNKPKMADDTEGAEVTKKMTEEVLEVPPAKLTARQAVVLEEMLVEIDEQIEKEMAAPPPPTKKEAKKKAGRPKKKKA